MERGPLREIEDTITVTPITDSKRDSPMKYEDKENIDFDPPNNNLLRRKSIFRTFDPFYSSPVCIHKRENDVDSNCVDVENCSANDTSFIATEFDSIFTATEILHYTTAIEPKSLDSLNLNCSEQYTEFDSADSLSVFLDTENSSSDVPDYILNILLDRVSQITEKNTGIIGGSLKDMSETITLEEQELSDLKLQLNQCQQVRATLELQLRQKEEIIIKTEAEFQRREVQYKQEIKQLKEKIEEKKEDVKDEEVKKLKDNVEKLKLQEKKMLDQINKFTLNEDSFKQVMEEYDKSTKQHLSEIDKLKRENETVQRHLATLELAFADVHQKYERSKVIIEGYKNNEESMQQGLLLSNDTIKKNEEKYESLRAHAKAQIDKSNKDLNVVREKSQAEFNKLTAIIKRLEIKNASLVNALDQKTKECAALSALCDEVTGPVE